MASVSQIIRLGHDLIHELTLDKTHKGARLSREQLQLIQSLVKYQAEEIVELRAMYCARITDPQLKEEISYLMARNNNLMGLNNG